MKPLAEGFRVYSRSAPTRELRPPKSSLAKASDDGRRTRHKGRHALITLAVIGTLGAFFLFFAALS